MDPTRSSGPIKEQPGGGTPGAGGLAAAGSARSLQARIRGLPLEGGGVRGRGMQSVPPSGPGRGRAPGRRPAGCPRDELASQSKLREGTRWKAKEGARELEGASRTRATDRLCRQVGPPARHGLAAPGAGLPRHGGGGDLGPGLREDVPARRTVPPRRCQRAATGVLATLRRMPMPHRLCAPLPQPPGPGRHAGGRPQPGAAAGHSRPPTPS